MVEGEQVGSVEGCCHDSCAFLPNPKCPAFTKDLQGKIDFTDPESSEEFRLELDGVHFVSNGSIYAFAEPSGYVVASGLPSLY